MHSTQRALALLLLSGIACGERADAPPIQVRSAQIDGDFQYFDVVVDGSELEVFVDVRPDGDRIAAIVDDVDHGVAVFESAQCDEDALACTLAEEAFTGSLAELADEQVASSPRLRFLGCDIDYDGTGNYICISCPGPYSTWVDCFPA